MKIHHYGLATTDIVKSIATFKDLGHDVGKIIEDPIQKVQLAFVNAGAHFIELIMDLDNTGPTQQILSKNGTSLYHICYETDAMETTIAELRSKGFLLRHKPTPAIAFNNRKIAWLYSPYSGLIELVESA